MLITFARLFLFWKRVITEVLISHDILVNLAYNTWKEECLLNDVKADHQKLLYLVHSDYLDTSVLCNTRFIRLLYSSST